jgi:hypothetical protein
MKNLHLLLLRVGFSAACGLGMFSPNAMAQPLANARLEIQLLADGAIGIGVDGGTLAGLRLERSENLIDWETVHTGLEGAGPFLHMEEAAGAGNRQFYRLVQDAGSLAVTPVIDEARAVSKSIGFLGGTLVVESADELIYTLTIPQGAVLSPVDMRMAPLSSIQGLPFSGGLLGGVEIEPDGLHLFDSALLTIEGASIEPLDDGFRIAGFGYYGEGTEFHLYPLNASEEKIVLSLIHFSGYGVGTATEEDLERQRTQHPPGSRQARDNQERPEDVERIIDWLIEFWLSRVQPLLEQATTDESVINLAFSQFLWWLNAVRDANLETIFRNAEPSPVQQSYALLAFAVQNAIEKAHETCLSENDPHQTVIMFRWLLWAFQEPEIVQWLDVGDLEEKARSCATFELTFASMIELTDRGAIWSRAELEATVLIEPVSLADIVHGRATGALFWYGTDTLHYRSFVDAFGDTACEKLVGTVDSVMRVEDFYLNLNMPFQVQPSDDDLMPPLVPLHELSLRINPGVPAELWDVAERLEHCGGGPFIRYDEYWWNETFFALHAFEHAEADKMEVIKDEPSIDFWLLIDEWTFPNDPQNPALIARKVYEHQDPELLRHKESTLLELRHTP